MPYTVVWSEKAIQELAALWLAAPDREAVTKASDEIDYWIRLLPLTVGIPFGNFRRFKIEPLEVRYSVSPADCLVRILGVRRVA